jgi:CheY-like chemotaxis protein
MRILIVEDNDISAGILESNLRQRHYNTVIARTVPEALKHLTGSWDIGLALVDIMLPETDGLELVRKMRDDPMWQDIPVIICTSLADSSHVSEAARLGCRHYLLKPIDRVKLIMMVDKLLSGQQQVAILGDPQKVSAQYGLSSDALDRLYTAFANVVDESIAVLDPGPSGPSANSTRMDLAKLMEGAITLGAERLMAPVQALQARGFDAPTPASKEYNLILTELKLIQRALSARSQSNQTMEEPVNADQPANENSANKSEGSTA